MQHAHLLVQHQHQTVESITEIVTSAGKVQASSVRTCLDLSCLLLSIAEIFITDDVRPGRSGERWVNLIAQKM